MYCNASLQLAILRRLCADVLHTKGALGDLSLENGEGANGPKMKRPGRPNALRRFIKLGLSEPAHEVSLRMEDFRENVEKKELYLSPEDPKTTPTEWAQQKVHIYAYEACGWYTNLGYTPAA